MAMASNHGKPAAKTSQEPVTLKVRVQPKASHNQVEGYRGDTLRLRVTAPPEAGKANLAVVSLLAERLGIAKSNVRIIRGQASRDKVVLIESLTPEAVRRSLSG